MAVSARPADEDTGGEPDRHSSRRGSFSVARRHHVSAGCTVTSTAILCHKTAPHHRVPSVLARDTYPHHDVPLGAYDGGVRARRARRQHERRVRVHPTTRRLWFSERLVYTRCAQGVGGLAVAEREEMVQALADGHPHRHRAEEADARARREDGDEQLVDEGKQRGDLQCAQRAAPSAGTGH
jgi:hypothetical protein